MDFANCIITYDRSREGSVRGRAAWLTLHRSFPVDPSRPGLPALISIAKPIPFVQVFDKVVIALEDSTKVEDPSDAARRMAQGDPSSRLAVGRQATIHLLLLNSQNIQLPQLFDD